MIKSSLKFIATFSKKNVQAYPTLYKYKVPSLPSALAPSILRVNPKAG